LHARGLGPCASPEMFVVISFVCVRVPTLLPTNAGPIHRDPLANSTFHRGRETSEARGQSQNEGILIPGGGISHPSAHFFAFDLSPFHGWINGSKLVVGIKTISLIHSRM
jgi:hypothetical protein